MYFALIALIANAAAEQLRIGCDSNAFNCCACVRPAYYRLDMYAQWLRRECGAGLSRTVLRWSEMKFDFDANTLLLRSLLLRRDRR